MGRRPKYSSPKERQEARNARWRKWGENDVGQRYYHRGTESATDSCEDKASHLYAVWNEKAHRVKIGRNSDASRRAKELQAGNHHKLSAVRVWEK